MLLKKKKIKKKKKNQKLTPPLDNLLLFPKSVSSREHQLAIHILPSWPLPSSTYTISTWFFFPFFFSLHHLLIQYLIAITASSLPNRHHDYLQGTSLEPIISSRLKTHGQKRTKNPSTTRADVLCCGYPATLPTLSLELRNITIHHADGAISIGPHHR